MQKIMQNTVFKRLFGFSESFCEDPVKIFHDFGDTLITMLEKPESKSEGAARIRFLMD